jgi:chromosome segregation ATPase
VIKDIYMYFRKSLPLFSLLALSTGLQIVCAADDSPPSYAASVSVEEGDPLALQERVHNLEAALIAANQSEQETKLVARAAEMAFSVHKVLADLYKPRSENEKDRADRAEQKLAEAEQALRATNQSEQTTKAQLVTAEAQTKAFERRHAEHHRAQELSTELDHVRNERNYLSTQLRKANADLRARDLLINQMLVEQQGAARLRSAVHAVVDGALDQRLIRSAQEEKDCEACGVREERIKTLQQEVADMRQQRPVRGGIGLRMLPFPYAKK